jgi:hypothetical protein
VAPDGTDKGGSISLAGIPLPCLEGQAVRFARILIHPADDAREVADLTRDFARLTQALRRWAGLSAGESPSTDTRLGDWSGRPWRMALLQLRDYAVDGRSDELLGTVVGAINGPHHLGALKEDAIVRRQIDPAGWDPARLALELDLGVDFEIRLARGPVLSQPSSRWRYSGPILAASLRSRGRRRDHAGALRPSPPKTSHQRWWVQGVSGNQCR